MGVSSAQNSKYITSSLYAVLLTVWETRGKNLEFLKKLDTHVQGSLLLHFKTFQGFPILLFFRFVRTSILLFCFLRIFPPGAFRCAARAPRLWRLEARAPSFTALGNHSVGQPKLDVFFFCPLTTLSARGLWESKYNRVQVFFWSWRNLDIVHGVRQTVGLWSRPTRSGTGENRYRWET